jgi:nitrogen fixation/metabolism regulation signal transduction histidine kinase
MISRSLYLNIFARIILIVLFSLLLGYLISAGSSFRFILLDLLAMIIVSANLIHYLNTTNRNIRFFFDSVKNDDSSLSFQTNQHNSTFSELNASMNRVNQQIKKLKIENRSQEQFFQILLEQIATGIITFNSKGFILHANSAVKKLLSVNVLTHLQQIEKLDPGLYHAIRTIRPGERRLVPVSTPYGDIQLALNAVTFSSGSEEMMILSVEDIKKELDEKELESWMKLIRVLTHEIMNTITPIASLSESLSNIYTRNGSPVNPGDVTETTISTTLKGLDVIREQGKGLRAFVESYRQFTRIPEPVRKPVRADDLLERIRILYGSMPSADKFPLHILLKNPVMELNIDANLISQVMLNLLKNAVEANEGNPDPRITVTAGYGPGNNPEICVIDNGPGIPENLLDDIFVPFFTTRQNGSGIGLSISRQIMRVHGGNLKVRSSPGRETAFCLTF